ncbi:MAG: M18 family aminopeptidase [gamma proteobacterium symbiont of Taylorina sp.]|nr:M18 family aminopeptidase [gamma proteobacterium symbiont of Taylorina sp.]
MTNPLNNVADFNQDLMQFIDASPTPFHVVDNQITLLEEHGFKRLYESEPWSLAAGQRYYVTRNHSALIAFIAGKKEVLETGIRLFGAHTDSPCLKVKPNAEIMSHSYLQLGVEVYGGALLNPWFDRDLSLAGRVVYCDNQDKLYSCLIDFKKPIATIPSLAIHLDRDANKKRMINSQTDLPPVLMKVDDQDPEAPLNSSLNELLRKQLVSQYKELEINKILDYELSFYDTQKAAYVGLNNDFIASSRLDNLLSCFIGIQSLINVDNQSSSLLVCSDHEEVGSASTAGAQGSFLKSVLERLSDSAESLNCIIDKSMLVSADNAHGIHPNFSDKHDASHGPLFNQGPVIKVNANQRYATNSETGAVIKLMAEKAGIPIQNFVVRTDLGCGSTIGPITAAEIGIKTLDIGVPTFAMHSIRELCGYKDSWYMYQLMKIFFDVSQEISINHFHYSKS